MLLVNPVSDQLNLELISALVLLHQLVGNSFFFLLLIVCHCSLVWNVVACMDTINKCVLQQKHTCC